MESEADPGWGCLYESDIFFETILTKFIKIVIKKLSLSYRPPQPGSASLSIQRKAMFLTIIEAEKAVPWQSAESRKDYA